jgi:3D (Asp-Asp-Asp) domain-containing protein
MKFLASRSVALSLLALIVSFFYAEPQVGEAFDLANNGQNKINRENPETEAPSLEGIENISFTISETHEDSNENKNATTDKKATFNAFRATAYCLKGRTAVGGSVRRGIVAADPRILPLGTRIQMTAGSYTGTYVVADTGGAVRGRILDVWVPTCSEAMRFGRRSVTVSIVGR